MSLRVRPPRPDEAAVVAALGNAYGRTLGGDPGRSDADIRDDWAGLGDVRRDAWLVERDGVPAGHACLQDDGHGRLFALGWVGPDHAGHGVGAALVDRDRGEDARARGRRRPGPDRAPQCRPARGSRCPRAARVARLQAHRGARAHDRRPRCGASGSGLAGRGCGGGVRPGHGRDRRGCLHRRGVLERVEQPGAVAGAEGGRPTLRPAPVDRGARRRRDVRRRPVHAGYVRHGFRGEPRGAGAVAAAGAGGGASARELRPAVEPRRAARRLWASTATTPAARRLYERLGMRIAWIADGYEKEVRA